MAHTTHFLKGTRVFCPSRILIARIEISKAFGYLAIFYLFGSIAPAQQPRNEPVSDTVISPWATPSGKEPIWLERDPVKLNKSVATQIRLNSEPVIGNFGNKTLKEALESISEQIDLTIILNLRNEKDKNKAEKIDEKTKLPRFKHPVSARVALRAILEPLGYTFQVDEELIFVVGMDQDFPREQRTYDLSWIAPNNLIVPHLHSTIIECVQAEWSEHGGDDRLSFVGSLMVVVSSTRTHQRIEDLLRSLNQVPKENFPTMASGKVKAASTKVESEAELAPPELPPSIAAPIAEQKEPVQQNDPLNHVPLKNQPLILQEWTQPTTQQPEWLGNPMNETKGARSVLRNRNVKGTFDGVALRQVISDFSEQVGYPFVFDEMSLSDAGKSADDLVSISLQDPVPLHVALKTLLKQMEMVYAPRERHIEICTIDDGDCMVLQSFDLSHLFPDNSKVEELIAAIHETIDGNWDVDGGTDTIRFVGPMMFVSASEVTIETIEGFLQDLASIPRESFRFQSKKP